MTNQSVDTYFINYITDKSLNIDTALDRRFNIKVSKNRFLMILTSIQNIIDQYKSQNPDYVIDVKVLEYVHVLAITADTQILNDLIELFGNNINVTPHLSVQCPNNHVDDIKAGHHIDDYKFKLRPPNHPNNLMLQSIANEVYQTESGENYMNNFFPNNNVYEYSNFLDSKYYKSTFPDNDTNYIIVAIIDSGVDHTHPHLKDSYIGYHFIYSNGHCTIYNNLKGSTVYPTDINGHGTEVAGLLCGTKTGLIPRAKWTSIRVSDDDVVIDPQIILRCINSLLNEYANNMNSESDITLPHIINLSLGAPLIPNTPINQGNYVLMWNLFNNLATLGISIICATGNYIEGIKNNTMAFPGSLNNVLTVGALSLNPDYKREEFLKRTYDTNEYSRSLPDISLNGSRYIINNTDIIQVNPSVNFGADIYAIAGYIGNKAMIVTCSMSQNDVKIMDGNAKMIASCGTSIASPQISAIVGIIYKYYYNKYFSGANKYNGAFKYVIIDWINAVFTKSFMDITDVKLHAAPNPFTSITLQDGTVARTVSIIKLIKFMDSCVKHNILTFPPHAIPKNKLETMIYTNTQNIISTLLS
jgi:subtilisin family serine protease